LTLREALAATRKRRLRPTGYVAVSAGIFALLFLILAARLGANIYLCWRYAIAHPDPHIMAFYVLANVAWCALFLAAASPLASYRGVARTLESERLRLLPVRTAGAAWAMASSAFLSIPVLVPIGLALATCLFGAAVSGGAGPALPLAAAVVSGLGCFVAVTAVAWRLGIGEAHLELIELTILTAMVFVNPDFGAHGGVPAVKLLNHWELKASQAALIPALPVLGATVAVVLLFLVAVAAAIPRVKRSEGAPPGLALYTARMPLGIFVAGYVLELGIILTNPDLATTVRNVVVAMFCVRALWFVSFLFGSEQQIGTIFHVPATPRTRLTLYRPAVFFHLLLCLPPPLLFVFRLLPTAMPSWSMLLLS
jgi:hypothetical protein